MFGAFRTFGRMGAAAGRTIAQQIAAMFPSLWLEPSVTNGYQNSAGTTALTQPGAGSADPPVGKAMDLSGNGNHAIQATSTARPKLSARRNLLTYTGALSNASWQVINCSKATSGISDPFGGTTAIQLDLTATHLAFMHQTVSAAPPPFVNQSWYAKALSGTKSIRIRYNDQLSNQFSQDFLLTTEWTRINASFTSSAGITYQASICNDAAGTAGSIIVCAPQFETGSTATAYQRVTDANNYDYAGWPLIHQFDGVDDVLNVTFPSSLGSDCTVVTANRGTTPTIATGQTIGTSYTINTTNAGRLVFPRALTAAETAIVTAWATKKGALP